MEYGLGVEDSDLYFENDFIRVYERVSPSTYKHGFAEVTDEEKLFDKPTLLCLGPVDCFHGNPVTANGFAKAASRIVGRRGVYDGAMRVLSITHPYSHSVPRMVEDYNYKVQFEDPEGITAWSAVRKFTEDKFTYLFFKDGKLRDTNQIKKQLRNLNIITHSLGGVIIQQVGNLIYEMLNQAGLDDKSIAEITREIFVLTIGNPAPFVSNRASFTQLHVYGLGDRIAYARCTENHDEIEKTVKSKPQLQGKNLAILPIGHRHNNMVLCVGDIELTQKQRREMDYRKIPPVITADVPRANFQNGKFEISVPPEMRGYTLEHRADLYLTFGIGTHGLMVPTAIATSLSNALQNSIINAESSRLTELPSVRKLLIAPRLKAEHLDGWIVKIIDHTVKELTPDKEHPNWREALTAKAAERRADLIHEAVGSLNYRYKRSDPNSEKAYARTEDIADGIGYNQRIAEACGERTEKGTPRSNYR